MLNNFLDKKNLQEITQIFKQHVQYQYSSKEQLPDISVSQQDKINRFLNCYSPYFTDYLMQDNTYQHFDYYRILSKYIKVFDLEKGKKFRSNNYDGLYIILKGCIQEIIVQDQQIPEDLEKDVQQKKNKSKQQDPLKMSKIVNMVVGINRIKGSSSDVTQRESFQTQFNKNITDSDCNHFFGNTPYNEGQSNINSQRNQQNSQANSMVAFNSNKPSSSEIDQNNNQFFIPRKPEYLPNSPEPQNSQSRSNLLNQLNYQVKINAFNQEPQDDTSNSQKRQDQIQTIENKLIQEDTNQQKFPQNIQANTTQKRNIENLKLQLNLIKHDNFKLQKGDTEIYEEKLDDVHELHYSPTKIGSNENGEKKQLLNHFSSNSSSSSNLLASSPLKVSDNPNDKMNYIEQMTSQISMNKINNLKLKKKLSFMIAMQPKSQNPFPQYQNKPFNILTNGDIIDLIKIKDSQRKYFVQEIEDSICLYIGKKSMQKAFQEQVQQLRYKVSVIEKFFHNVPHSKIVKLAYHFYEKTLFKNQTVYKQGDKGPHFIYLLKSGEVQVSETIKNQLKKEIKTQEKVEQQEEDDQSDKEKTESDKNIKDDETYDLQSLCRKKLNNKNDTQHDQLKMTLQIPKLTKILCSLGEGEIFGIEEIILQKESREFQVVVSSSQAEFYIMPDDLFETFRQTESDSILSWFKQKEKFYQQQRNMHQRIKGNRVIAKSSNQEFFFNKKIQKACQYLFQEDEQTFNNRLDQLHNKKIIQLKNYYQYKEYQSQNQSTKGFSQSYMQANNDSLTFTSPRNTNQTQDRNFSKETQQSDNLTQQNVQNQVQSSKALLLSKISQQSQSQKAKSYCDIQTTSQSTIHQIDSQRGQIGKQEIGESFKNNPLIKVQNIQQQDNPYLLTERGSIKHSLINGTPSVERGNSFVDEANQIHKSVRRIENQVGLVQIKKATSSNYSTVPEQQNFQQNNQDQNCEQYKIQVTKNDAHKKQNQQASKYQGDSMSQLRSQSKKNSRVLKSQESQCSIHLDQSQGQIKQNNEQQQQAKVGIPRSLEYISKHNEVQSSGDVLNLGRIHHMIKSNTKIIKQQLKLKGKNQLFQKPIFDELKKENIKQLSRYIPKKTSEEKQKTQQPLSGRWQNTAKNMENIQKYQEYIKTSTSFNNTNTPRLKLYNDYNSSQSFVNLQTPRSLNNVLPTSAKSLTQTDINSSPVVNIHMENKRKIQRTNEPYFTRPFSRADQCTPGKSSTNFASLSKHRTIQSSNIKQRHSTEDQEEIQQLIQNSKKQALNFKNIISSQFSFVDRLPLSQRNEFENSQSGCKV